MVETYLMIFCLNYFPLCILIGLLFYFLELPVETLNMNKPEHRNILETFGVSMKKVNVYKTED